MRGTRRHPARDDRDRAGARGTVACAGVRVHFPGARAPAVDGVDLEVDRGQVVGLLGPSGAGKSTLLRVLTGRLRRFGGSAWVLDHDVADRPPWVACRIGVSFEDPACFERLTAREQLDFFAALTGRPCRPVDELLGRLGMGDAADERAGTFSRGMRVRLDLARALQHEPDVLLLDEPTAGLDPVTTRLVRDLVAQEAERGAAVLLATHDMETAQELADHVALIADGRVVVRGSPRSLRRGMWPARVRVERRSGDGVRTVELDLHDREALAALVAAGGVETIHTTEASLGDVFVAHAGRALS